MANVKITNKEEKSGKSKVKNSLSGGQMEKMIGNAVEAIDKLQKEEGIAREPIEIKTSKPISKLKKGDKIKIDGKKYEVDTHYVLIDHGPTKEMAIEIFDEDDRDFQLRYFDDQVEGTLELYELQEIMYFKKPLKKVEW